MNHNTDWPEHIASEADCYFHDVLTPRKKMHVEQHCAQCEMCRTALEEARKRFEATKNVTASEPGDALLHAALAKVDAHESARRRRIKLLRRSALGAMAAMLLLALGGWIYYANLGPSPYELRILGPIQLAADTDAGLRVWVMHHDKGQGVEKVPVTIELADKDEHFTELVTFNTDVHGTGDPVFHLPAWNDGDYQLRVTAKPGGAPQVLTQRIRLQRHWKLMLSSDRPIYQPGQVIHVRSLALGTMDLKPAVGQNVVFRVVDPKGNVIFKQKEVASKFGIASTDCLLADEILEGLYTVQCQLGDGDHATTNAMKVQVQKYVLPRFRIAVNFDKPYVQPGQRLTGKVKAEYFFGKPLGAQDGLIELELSKGWTKPGTPERLSLPPGKDGETSFEFPRVPEAFLTGDKAEETLDLAVRVTDSAGQVETRKVPVIVTNQPLRIEVVPEAGSLAYGLDNIVFVQVSSADGKPVKARVTVSGVQEELVTNELGLATFHWTTESDTADWTIQAQDDAGQTGRREIKLACSKNLNDVILRPDKAVYESGDAIWLRLLGYLHTDKNHNGSLEPIFVDVLKEGQCVGHYSWLPNENMKIQLPADWFGTLQLRSYRMKGEEILGARTRVIYVRPPEKVRIATTTDRQECRPGARANLVFQLTDSKGRFVPGALSLAAVDESVFSVLEQSQESASSFFTWSSGQLPSTSNVAHWSPELPDAGEEKDRRLFEMFAFAGSYRAIARQLSRRQPREFGNDYHLSTYRENVRQFVEKKEAFEGVARTIFGILVFLAGLAVVLGVGYLIARVFLSDERRLRRKVMAGGLIGVCIVSLILCTGLGPNLGPVKMAATSQIGVERSFFGTGRQRGKGAPDIKLGSDIAGGTILTDDKDKAPPSKISLGTGGIQDSETDLKKSLFWRTTREPSSPEPARIRDWFPETLLWRPELITDDQGRANLNLDLADSITTWRLTASAVTGDGRLGASQEKIKVFQPFFVEVRLPVALTRGDEVAVPVVVYSYVDKAQEVVVKLADGAWFDRLDVPEKRLTLQPHEVKATHFRLRAKQVGKHELLVTANGAAALPNGRGSSDEPRPLGSDGAALADAIKRQIEVVPDGRAVETAWNGVLGQPFDLDLAVPEDATPDSARLLLKIYPSAFSQVLEGLDSIFRMPSGCFEQTSSTTYPNVLALDYLIRTKKKDEKVEQKARNFIHLGYQRLLSFEIPTGGFDWFGRPPANRTLTAYGLMEFIDMARVHDVDPQLIARTRKWLLDQRKPDGSWDPEGHVPANLPSGSNHVGGTELAQLSTTAYIAWSVFHAAGRGTPSPAGNSTEDAAPTRKFLLKHPAGQIDDPHVLALTCNALLAIDAQPNADAIPYLARLEEVRKTSPDGKQAYWQQRAGDRTTFYGAGRSGEVETTALATLALMQAQRSPATVAAALTWISNQRDAGGTWHSTQATVLALKALLAGNDAAVDPNGAERRIRLTWADGEAKTIVIPADQAEVMWQDDLTRYLRKGKNRLTMTDLSATRPGYQVVLRYYEPSTNKRRDGEPFFIQVRYGKEEVKVGDLLEVKATVRNEQKDNAAMVMVELPIPAGFHAELGGWSKLVEQGRIAKFQLQPGRILVYLRDLEAGKSLELAFGLRAQMSARIQVPAARVYEYYNPARTATSATALLVVK